MSFLSRWFPTPDEPSETRNWTVNATNATPPDPNLVTLFGGFPSAAGVTVSEQTVLGIPAVRAAVSTIADTIAQLPLHTIIERADGTHDRLSGGVLDDPGRVVGLTAFDWKHLVLTHLLIHGNAFLLHVRGGAGQLVGLQPVHPSVVAVEVRSGQKVYKVQMANGATEEFRDYRGDGLWDHTLTHIFDMSTNGITGLSPLQLAKNMFGAAISAERSATQMFGRGPLITSIAQFDDDVTAEEAKAMMDDLERKITGPESAGKIAHLNRNMKLTPVSLSNTDAQWIETRAFQIEEIARWFRVPPHLLAQTEKQTSWGAGVEEQNLGLSRYNLEPWTTKIQERLTWLLQPSQKAEFFYSAFLESDPETEINVLLAQVQAGVITINEFRKIRNLPPVEGGDALGVAA